MNRKKRDPATLTDKDCDDWFALLDGKSVQNTHPDIQQDTRILRTLADEYQQKKIAEKKNNKANTNKHWLGLSPQPAFLLLFLTLASPIIYLISMRTAVHIVADTTSPATDVAFGFTPAEGKSQSGLVNALNQPVIIDKAQKYVGQLSHLFSELNFQQDKSEGGIIVRIHITETPNAALSEQLQHYGFNAKVGRQYMYFKETPASK